MQWLKNVFRTVPKEEREGIHLDPMEPHWELKGPRDFTQLFRALQGWLPAGSVLHFEGGSPDREIKKFMAEYAIPEKAHLEMGTIWPVPRTYHVPAGEETLVKLADIMKHHAEPELAIHFHVYQGDTVLLEWYDAFTDPLWINGSMPEEKVKAFADKIGRKYAKVTS